MHYGHRLKTVNKGGNGVFHTVSDLWVPENTVSLDSITKKAPQVSPRGRMSGLR